MISHMWNESSRRTAIILLIPVMVMLSLSCNQSASVKATPTLTSTPTFIGEMGTQAPRVTPVVNTQPPPFVPLRFEGSAVLETTACNMQAYVILKILDSENCKVIVEFPMNCLGDHPRGVSFTMLGKVQSGSEGSLSTCEVYECVGTTEGSGSFSYDQNSQVGEGVLACGSDRIVTFQDLPLATGTGED